MSPRHLPQPSADAARRRLAGLLDATPDTGWEDVPDPDPAAPGPSTIDPDPGIDARSRPRAGAWRRETVLVLGAVVLVGVVLAGLVLLRSTPLEITDGAGSAPVAADVTPLVQVTPGQTPVPTAAASSPAPTSSPSAAPASLAAHVIGEVQRPGLVVLVAGARVDDAITAAGGLTSRADPGDLNLAQPLQDGQQVVVGSSSEPGGEVRGPGAGATPAAAGASIPAGGQGGTAVPGQASGDTTVDLNTASALELEELPGVGPATAQKIITWREQNGGFATVEQLMDVPGIGPKTYAEIAPRART